MIFLQWRNLALGQWNASDISPMEKLNMEPIEICPFFSKSNNFSEYNTESIVN